MPNWCHNTLIINGPGTDRDRFKDHGVDFNSAIPYPPEFQRLDDLARAYEAAHPDAVFKLRPIDGFNSGGREWREQHWGTKWNACDVSADERDDGLRYCFDTAWAPPLPAVAMWSKAYPTLAFTLEFSEPLGDFAGTFRARSGEASLEEREIVWTDSPSGEGH